MNILYDDNMPYAQQYFGSLNANSSGVVKSFTPNQIDDKDLLNCDALLVRSTTTVDAELIAKAPNLKYVATATAGFNHLDLQALEAANVSWYSAGGCNARAVAEYVISALLLLAERQDFCLADRSVALVGVGNVGKALSNLLSCLGIHVIEYDPPRASTDRAFVSASFEQVLAADIISLHVPFVAHGQYRTGHMFDSNILAKLNNTQILINASRGEVIDNQAVKICKQISLLLKASLETSQNVYMISKMMIVFFDATWQNHRRFRQSDKTIRYAENGLQRK